MKESDIRNHHSMMKVSVIKNHHLMMKESDIKKHHTCLMTKEYDIKLLNIQSTIYDHIRSKQRGCIDQTKNENLLVNSTHTHPHTLRYI